MLKRFTPYFLIIISFGIVFGVGFHSTNEILPGTFNGNYSFEDNVGIGISNPVTKLEVSDSVKASYFETRYGLSSNAYWNGGSWAYRQDGYAWQIYSRLDRDHFKIQYKESGLKDVEFSWKDVFYINGSSGNVGIGTNQPLTKLHIQGNISANSICDESGNNCKDISTGWSSSISCPAGFTLLESQGKQLGCIQNNEDGSAVWTTAMQNCWINYSGRLPSPAEWFIGMNNHVLIAETDDWEWTEDSAYYQDAKVTVGNGAIYASSYDTNANTKSKGYRCFIPK